VTESERPGSAETVTGRYAAADLPPGTVVADRFRIESIVGIGGMGVVYRATDLALGIQVAIKLLRPEVANRVEAIERFRQELLLARQVSSPRVVRIHDIAQHQNRLLITMDLIEGESLDRLLDRRGALPLEEALGITRQLAEGLAAAHARGVMHRDLKPSNVLIDGDGNACISDFGVARSLGDSSVTQAGVIIGTPDYLSPEQAKGAPVDGRSDLYALGLILHEMLTGQQAFAGTTAAESLSQRLVRPPPPASGQRPDLPTWVQRLLSRLLQPRPAHRFADAAAVIRAIDQRRVPLDLRPGRRTGFAAAILIVLAVLTWMGSRLPSPLPPPTVDQLVVLSGDAPPDAGPAWAAGVEHLRQALAALPAFAVVDGDRTAQAVAQLGLTDEVRVEPDAVRELVPARRSLRVTVEHEANGYRLSGELSDGKSTRRVVGTVATSLTAAIERFGQALAAEVQAEGVFAASLLPRDDDSLAAYGRALLTRRDGNPEAALPPLQQAIEREPAYAAAWLALAETAWLTGRFDLAGQAVQQGLSAPAPARLKLDLKMLAGLVDGDIESIVQTVREHLDSQPDDLAATLRLGQLLGESGDYEGAAAALEALLTRDPNDPRAWYLLGKYTILRGNARRAVDEYLLRALVLNKRGRNPYGEAEAANALGIGYLRLGQTADAEEQYRRALDLRRFLNDRRGMAATLRNLAQVATFRGRTQEAETHLTEAGSLYEALGDHAGLAAIDRQLGLMAEERGDYVAALEAYRRVLRAREQAGDSHDSAESLNDIGFAHYQLGDYDSAQVFWRQAGEAFTRLDDPRGMVRAQQNLGLLYIVRGRWGEARGLLESTLAEAERRQLAEEAAVSRRNLAELEIMQGHLGTALNQIDRAEALFRELEDQRGLVDVALLRARALTAIGALDQARKVLAEVGEDLEQTSREHQAITALLRVELARRTQRQDEAQIALVDAQRAAAASGVAVLRLAADTLGQTDPEKTFAAILALSDVPLQLTWYQLALQRHIAVGDYAAAAVDYRRAAALIDGLGDYFGAFMLHRLGSLALTMTGENKAADTARAAASAALERLTAGLPESLRTALEKDPEVVAFREAGHGG
jgi:tetratricopeptide (TPR) repeat protein